MVSLEVEELRVSKDTWLRVKFPLITSELWTNRFELLSLILPFTADTEAIERSKRVRVRVRKDEKRRSRTLSDD